MVLQLEEQKNKTCKLSKSDILFMEKYNAGAIFGWRILRVTPDNLYSVKTLNMIKEAINNGKV